MSKLRRLATTDQVFFITSVTYRRFPILTEHFDLLQNAICRQRERTGMRLLAWVVLPDHFHMVLDPRQVDISQLQHNIKISFSIQYCHRTGYQGKVWQLRFWDHIVRDERDLLRRINYVHYNPVKHGLTQDPLSYKYSSLQEWIRRGGTPDWSLAGSTDTDSDGE